MMILSWQIAKKIWWQIAKKIWQVDKYMTSRLKIRTSQLLNYMYLTSGGRNMPSWMEQYITCDDIYMYKEYSSRRNMWVYDADNSIYMVARWRHTYRQSASHCVPYVFPSSPQTGLYWWGQLQEFGQSPLENTLTPLREENISP